MTVIIILHVIFLWLDRRLTDKLSNAQGESNTLQNKLKDSEQQVANMKQKLHKYVQEVKRAEDLLMEKVCRSRIVCN